MNALTCDACGYTGHDVRVRLVRHQEYDEGSVSWSQPARIWYDTAARCTDEQACEVRQAATGFGVRT